MSSDEGSCKAALRAFAVTFPPLKIALWINDIICYLFGALIDAIKFVARLSLRLADYIFRITFSLVKRSTSWLLKQLLRISFIREITRRRPYERLLVDFKAPIPYANSLFKRLFTYHGGLFLALSLYVFLYFVLVHQHTYWKIAVALVILFLYLIIIENSHTFRSVLMLCLPIMFTNRGRALVYCSMLTIMVNGPIRTLKQNVAEIHSSLTCCKQYLIVSSDKEVEENYVKKLVKVEEVIMNLVANIKQYARELKEQFADIVKLAIACEQYIIDAINRLTEIVNICNKHTDDVYRNCNIKMINFKTDCGILSGPFRGGGLCGLLGPSMDLCGTVRIPNRLCQLPVQVINFLGRTIGTKLKQYIQVIQNEFYVDVDIDRKYSYNITQSKAYSKVVEEISFDVERKFWYVHAIARLFNFVTLILVIFILTSASIYLMHYQKELSYDNMYIDDHLIEVDMARRVEQGSEAAAKNRTVLDENNNLISIEDEEIQEFPILGAEVDNQNEFADINTQLEGPPSVEDPRSVIDEFDSLIEAPADENQELVDTIGQMAEQELGLNRNAAADIEQAEAEHLASSRTPANTDMPRESKLFPLNKVQGRQYLRPSSLHMNHEERSKLKWSTVVWVLIIGYIWFFVVLDFAFYTLISFLVDILRDILFTSDLPVIDLETRSRTSGGGDDSVVRYNRTYLAQLRRQQSAKLESASSNGSVVAERGLKGSGAHSNSSIQAFYRGLMDSIERDIPDDVAILNSLEECLPRPRVPRYSAYRSLLYLAVFTFLAVVVEAYALRTRHCIANLYYPERARARAQWLHRKMLAEKVKYEAESVEERSLVAMKSHASNN